MRYIPQYLTQDYISPRKIQTNSKNRMAVRLGIPQSSVLGLILYGGVLSLEYMEGVTTVAYADSLALIVETVNRERVGF